jgi:ABC-2 type transport system permease protein
MSGLVAIVRREMQAYFVSPIVYTVSIIFLLVSGIGFYLSVIQYSGLPASVIQDAGLNIRNFIILGMVKWFYFAMIICLPALSMRQLSEEKKLGTAELLLTSPVTTAQLVAGKFISAMLVLASMLLLTLPYAGILEWQAVLEWPSVMTAYLGLLLCGGALLSVGLLASSLTENQIVALLMTIAMWIPFMIPDILIGRMGGMFDDVLAGLSVRYGLLDLSQGLLDTHYLVLFLVMIATFLFLCVQVLDSNRWR